MILLLTTEKTEAIRREIPSLTIGSINPPPLPLEILPSLLLRPTLHPDPGFLPLGPAQGLCSCNCPLSSITNFPSLVDCSHQLAKMPPFFKGPPFTHPPLWPPPYFGSYFRANPTKQMGTFASLPPRPLPTLPQAFSNQPCVSHSPGSHLVKVKIINHFYVVDFNGPSWFSPSSASLWFLSSRVTFAHWFSGYCSLLVFLSPPWRFPPVSSLHPPFS